MRLVKSILIVFPFVLILLAGCGPIAGPIKLSSDLTIVEAKFGVYKAHADGSSTLITTDQVPLKPGTKFGWIMKVQTTRPDVSWREEFELSKPAQNWGSASPATGQKINWDRKMATTRLTSRPDPNGYIGNTWAIAEGDPPGEYSLRIYIGDNLVKTFKFWVAP